MDENPLPGLQFSVVEEPLPSAERGERDRGALDVVEGPRLWGEEVRRNRDEVRGGAVAVEAAERIDGLADLDATGVGAERGDDARELIRGSRREAIDGPTRARLA